VLRPVNRAHYHRQIRDCQKVFMNSRH